MEYLSPTGARFSFDGWAPGESPLECFDYEDYLGAMHGVMVAYTILINVDSSRYSYLTSKAVQDDGLLHELLHLHTGADICTFTSMEDLRGWIVDLQLITRNELKVYNATKSSNEIQ